MTHIETAQRRKRVSDAMSSLGLHDFAEQHTFVLPTREMTRDAIIRFARRYDPQPFHLDERAARATLLKGLCASGWHTCSVFMGAMQQGFLKHCLMPRLFAIDEVKWLYPVRPGDKIGGIVKATALNSPGPWPGTGQVGFEGFATNGKGRRVMLWKGRLAMPAYGPIATGVAADETMTVIADRRPGALDFLEAISAGDEVEIGNCPITSAGILQFNEEFELIPSAISRDTVSCEADGWYVAAMYMGRLVRFYLREAARLRSRCLPVPQLGPSPGISNLRWHTPVMAGDTLSFRAWAERKTAITANSDWGLLLGGCAAVNQRGELVLSFKAQLLLERRARCVAT